MSFKQVITVRTDIGMSRGKLVAQACHAAVGAYTRADGKMQADWASNGAKKIAAKTDSESAVMDLLQDAKARGLPAYLVKDAGETELEPGTVTAVGIGPGEEKQVDAVTEGLDLL